MIGHYQGLQLEQLADFARSTTQLFPHLEVSTLLHISDHAAERRQEKIRDRRVESRPTDDGMAMLALHHTADRIATTHRVITARARQLKAAGGETRTLAQLKPTSPATSYSAVIAAVAPSRCT